MRITVGMISKQYSKNLNFALGQLNYHNNRATNFRKFNKVSEDPISAARAYQLRQEFYDNENYKTNIRDVDNLMLTAETSVIKLNSLIQEAGSSDFIQAITGTLGKEEREIIGAKLKKVQESIVSTINTKFADKFIFGGANTKDLPFTVSKDGKLLYRNIDVDTGEHIGSEGSSATATLSGTTISFGNENGNFFNDYMIKVIDTKGANPPEPNTIDGGAKTITLNLNITGANPKATYDEMNTALKAEIAKLPPTDPLIDPDKITILGGNSIITSPGLSVISGGKDAIVAGTEYDLKLLANEGVYIDLGLGLQFDKDKNINTQSVFDVSLPGISFLGFGTKDGTETGIPNNIHSLLTEISNQLSSDNFDIDKIQPYIDSFKDQEQSLLKKMTEFGTKSNFIKFTEDKLGDMELNLNKKMLDVEQVSPEKAIMDFKMQEYIYMAVLQMGSKILQPTFLDFMR